jgi:Mce-associated membrane protein
VRIRLATGDDRRLLVLTWALSVVLLLVLAGLVVSVVALGRQDSRNDARIAAMKAARQTAVDFTTYKYDTWDADAQRVLDGATGPFKQEFTDTAAGLKEVVVSSKATSEGEVLDAAVESIDVDSAQVLVVCDAVVKNTASQNGTRRHYRMKLEMVREGDRWKVADLEAVG